MLCALSLLAGQGLGCSGTDADPDRLVREEVGGEEAASVTVRPVAGGPRTVFTVSTRMIFRPDEDGENYHFILRGPAGRQCERRRTSMIGFTPPEPLPERWSVHYAPSRFYLEPRLRRPRKITKTWCPGTFRGRVEFREPDQGKQNFIKLVGRFRFTVR